jgi:general secretion pathway protein K
MNERGFALVAVLLVLGLLGVVGAEFAQSMRLEASAVRAYKESIVAAHLAEAGVEQAIREISAEIGFAAVADDGLLTFYTRERQPLARLVRAQVPLGSGAFSYRITDEEARLNLNASPPDRLDRLLQSLGMDKRDRDVIVDSIQDWRDANEEHRLNGAESEDYYLKLPVPYRAHNANLESTRELIQVRGVTSRIFNGDQNTPGLVDLVTVKSPGSTVNINTAGDRVLKALGLADAEIAMIMQTRHNGLFAAVPGQFAGRGLTVATRTFRIDSEGLVNGQMRARLTAIVQKRSEGPNPSVAVLEWSGFR